MAQFTMYHPTAGEGRTTQKAFAEVWEPLGWTRTPAEEATPAKPKTAKPKAPKRPRRPKTTPAPAGGTQDPAPSGSPDPSGDTDDTQEV